MKNPTTYRITLGALRYLTNNGPDIFYIVNKVSQILQNPTNHHQIEVKRDLRYLRGTREMGIHIKHCTNLTLIGFSHMDWTCNLDGRKSVARYCIFFSDTLVSWYSKKQNVVARSNTESKYRALANVFCEFDWIQSLLKEISFPLPAAPITWCDNLSV